MPFWWSWDTAAACLAIVSVVVVVGTAFLIRLAARAEVEADVAEVMRAVGSRDGEAARLAFDEGRAHGLKVASLTAALTHHRGADAIVAELAVRAAEAERKAHGATEVRA